MKDQIKVEKINDLFNKARIAESAGDMINQELNLQTAFNKVRTLSSNVRTNIDNQFIIERMKLGRSYFIKQEFEKAIKQFDQVKTLTEYPNLNITDKCFLNGLLCHSKLIIGLGSGSEDLILSGKEINDKLIANLNYITDPNLKEGIIKDQKLIDAYENDDIKTIVEFEVPFPIIVKDQPINFDYDRSKLTIEIEIDENHSCPIKQNGSMFVEVVEDKYGIANKSKIKMTFYKFIDPYKIVEMDTLSRDKTVRIVFLEAIKAINFFIKRFRVISGRYWIDTIFHKRIQTYICKIIAGNDEIITIPYSDNQMYRISNELSWIKDEEFSDLKQSLIEDLELWKSLLLDAKDYLFRRNYREAIYSINGAFENFLMIKTREKLEKSWSTDDINKYLEGFPIYEYHDLKDYMAEESFIEAVQNNKIRPYIPPTGRIIKKCNQIDPSKVSHNQLKKLVYKIRRKRNEVMHGTELDEDLEKIAFKAIKSFEEFIEVF